MKGGHSKGTTQDKYKEKNAQLLLKKQPSKQEQNSIFHVFDWKILLSLMNPGTDIMVHYWLKYKGSKIWKCPGK